MPIVSRSDCTQTDVSEKYKFIKNVSSTGFKGAIHVKVKFNSCRGANNTNNDLEAYYQRLVNENKITTTQQEAFKKYIVGNNNCQATIDSFRKSRGYGYNIQLEDEASWTYVVGEGDPRQEEKDIMDGLKVQAMFNASKNKIMRRVCVECASTHQDIFYKRLTPLPADWTFTSMTSMQLVYCWFIQNQARNIPACLEQQRCESFVQKRRKQYEAKC